MTITFDASSGGKSSTSPLSYNHTIGSGTNRVLVISVGTNASAGSISATYNGVSFTLIATITSSSYTTFLGYILEANLPATGTYSVSISITGSPVGTNGIQSEVISLAGVAQQAPEANTTNSGGPALASLTTFLTTATADAWIVDGMTADGGVTTLTVGGSQTKRNNQSSTSINTSMSTHVTTAPGSYSNVWNFSGNATVATTVMAAFASADATPVIKDVRVKTGTFTTPAGTGNNAVTGVGFTPKALYLYWVPVTSSTAANDSVTGHGITDGSTHRCINAGGTNGAQATFRSRSTTVPLDVKNAAATTLAAASFVSFDTDGFTLNYTTAASGYIIHYVAFGGADVRAKVASSLASASPLTGLAFSPEFMILISNNSTGTATESFGTQSIGFANAALQEFDLTTYHGNNTSDQTQKRSVLRSTGFLAQVTTAVDYELSISGVTSDGFSWTGTNADNFDGLYLNFNGVRTYITTFTKATGAAPVDQTLPSFGFRAQAYGLYSANRTSETGAAGNVVDAYGVYDRILYGCIQATDDNSSTNADMVSSTAYVIGMGTTNANFDAAAVPKPIDGNAPVVTWNPNTGTASIIGVWGIETMDPYVLLPGRGDAFCANF